VSANHILQNFLSVENFLSEWKWVFRGGISLSHDDEYPPFLGGI
jgi:hypothetical protein